MKSQPIEELILHHNRKMIFSTLKVTCVYHYHTSQNLLGLLFRKETIRTKSSNSFYKKGNRLPHFIISVM